MSLNLFRLPPGSDQIVRPGRLSRALAIAARLYRAGSTLEEVNYDVFSLIAYGSWGDPVLGALAWLGRWRKFGDGSSLSPGGRTDLQSRQSGVHNFLVSNVPSLTDTRVIDALNKPDEELREQALNAVLADPTLEQPVLAESVAVLAKRAAASGRLDHWSILRFQRLEDAVFNVIATSTPN